LPGLAAPAAVQWPTIYLTEAVSGLSRPVFVTDANDDSGRLFIVEQEGRVRIAQNGALLVNHYSAANYYAGRVFIITSDVHHYFPLLNKT
jgi:hypothetical protein